MTAICVPIFVKGGVNLEEIIEDAEDVLDGTEGMMELRCDEATPRLLLEAMDLAHTRVLVTVHPKWEGGFCEKDDEYRIGLWEAAMEAGAEYVDVELLAWEKNKNLRDRVCEAAEKYGTRIVLSTHSFEGRPKDMDQRLARLRKIKQADVLKIAWKSESIMDGIEALRIMEQLKRDDGRPAVVLAMGEEGLISRLLAKKFGAAFTFAKLGAGLESAPGQPTVDELRDVYRWEDQDPSTPVYGVAGYPVAQSKSPLIHNAGFDEVNAPGVYVPFLIGSGGFGAAVEALRKVPGMNLRGMSVTIPHKEAAFKYVQARNAEVDELSAKIGVVNTLVWEGAGTKLRAFNSDSEGAIDALVSAWSGKREDLNGKRVAVMGAGGAARAIVAGLVAHGATVVVYNRTKEKSEALANEFKERVIAAEWRALPSSNCDVYINCTPLGMVPDVESAAFESAPASWSAQTVVFDTVYNPPMTRLLKLAQGSGAKIVQGTEMFLRQAAVQFNAFTGKAAPVEMFRKVLAVGRGA